MAATIWNLPATVVLYPPGHVLCPDGLFDAVHLLLVALAVTGGILLGLLQSRLQGLDPLSRSTKTLFQFRKLTCTASPFLHRLSSFSNQVIVFLRVLFFSFSLSYFCFHCSAVSSMFTVTVFLMVFALSIKIIFSHKIFFLTHKLKLLPVAIT
uniref:Uncharacterized protein n=1 Tax=Anabas testudineus TaxID=64144 RepID=A0A3Q1K323_ANATE